MTPYFFLQAAPGVAPAGPGLGVIVVQIGAIIAIFWFVLIRPQQRERKRLEQSLMEIKRGDEIVTAGGIIAEVVHIQMAPAAEGAESAARMDDRVTIRSGESKLVVERGRITRVAPKGS
ncbi:MAG TPA: preprotein translocase subunit YajC [Gemmatimonadaceae bacterium]|nr:preprotein translocase subunit YajC [Gemmatimonadaceae bacterium]